MNFEKFKAKTDFLIKKGLKDDDSLPLIVAAERCSAIKEFLDDAYESVLSDAERAYIETNYHLGVKRMLKDVLNMASKNPEIFTEMMEGLFGKGDLEEGEI